LNIEPGFVGITFDASETREEKNSPETDGSKEAGP
jgi:hypothetical protein